MCGANPWMARCGTNSSLYPVDSQYGSTRPSIHTTWFMCAHPLNKECTLRGNGQSCLPGRRPLAPRQSPPCEWSPMDHPSSHWSLQPPEDRPLGSAFWWLRQRPLLSRHRQGKFNTQRHDTAIIPSPAESWQCSGRGGRTPPRRSDPPCVRRPWRRCYMGSAPPSPRLDTQLTTSRAPPPPVNFFSWKILMPIFPWNIPPRAESSPPFRMFRMLYVPNQIVWPNSILSTSPLTVEPPVHRHIPYRWN